MIKQRNRLIILGFGLLVSIGHAQMNHMNHDQMPDSTMKKNMNNHDSTDMRDRDSMKMEGHDSMKMHDHKAMEMKQGMEKEKGTEKALYYTCSMESHKHVRSSEPGKCPECGMNLVKVVEVDEREADFLVVPYPVINIFAVMNQANVLKTVCYSCP